MSQGAKACALGLLVLSALPSPARGIDQPIDGLTAAVGRSVIGNERLHYQSSDPDVLFPEFDSADDPVNAGALIDLISPIEGLATLTVSPGDPFWRRRRGLVDAYVYRPPALSLDSLVRRIVLRRGAGLKVVARSAVLAMTNPHGQLGFRLRTGALRSCSLFAGDAVVRDVPGRFLGAGAPASAVADCEESSLGAPLVCGNNQAESGEECDGTDDSACAGNCTNTCMCDDLACDVVTPCPDEQFCEMPPGICASALDAGTCVETGDACPQVYQPVCGCDGATYGNDCERRVARVQKSENGPCQQCVTACDCDAMQTSTQDCPLLCPDCGNYWTCQKNLCVENCGRLPGPCQER